MATTRFASMPNVSLPRTKMGVSFTHPTSFTHGKVFPIFNAFVQPGDSFKLDLSALIRMSTPIAPIFGNIEFKAHSFFVPMRLLWEHTEEFFGENTTSAGPQTTEYTIPAAQFGYDTSHSPVVEGVSHYLGKPLHKSGATVPSSPVYASVLPERAYWLIINEYYRRQQLEAPIQVDTSDDGYARLDDRHESGGVIVTDHIFDRDCWTTSKKDDYFTTATISPQYSADPVLLPLGDFAPLAFNYENNDSAPYKMGALQDGHDLTPANKQIYFGYKTGALGTDGIFYGYSQTDGGLKVQNPNDGIMTNPLPALDGAFQTNIVADLTSATAASVNEVRLAFATQRFLERDLYGTRYPELIKAHFGVTSSLAILERPQLLYKASQYINIQQVLSTAGADTSVTTKLGQPGANSVTAFKAPIIHNAFDEFGILMILCETKFNRLYSQGLNKFDLKRTKFDFYFPEFATIGDQAITQAEIYALDDTQFKLTDVFGYQEAWAEYRYFPDRVSGKLDPQSEAGFNYWTLADDYTASSVDGINASFIKEDRAALARALVTGSEGPDYIGDFAVTGTMIRTMPLYSIPGLVDHVGGR